MALLVHHTTTPVQVTTAAVDTGPIIRRIVATGTLQATRTVDVGTQVSGVIDSLGADFNSIVHANQVIARLDPGLYEAALGQMRAAQLQAEADLSQSRASLEGARTADDDARTKFGRAMARRMPTSDQPKPEWRMQLRKCSRPPRM